MKSRSKPKILLTRWINEDFLFISVFLYFSLTGYTCTHIATFNENFELLAYLVHLGANISAADDKSGRRPIHYAVELGNLELTKFIVSRLSANVNATTFDLNTPLHVAAGRDLHRLVYFLLESGASRNAINCEGLTPYQVAKSDIMKSALRTVEYNDFTICGGGVWQTN